eukprot:290963_1
MQHHYNETINTSHNAVNKSTDDGGLNHNTPITNTNQDVNTDGMEFTNNSKLYPSTMITKRSIPSTVSSQHALYEPPRKRMKHNSSIMNININCDRRVTTSSWDTPSDRTCMICHN